MSSGRIARACSLALAGMLALAGCDGDGEPTGSGGTGGAGGSGGAAGGAGGTGGTGGSSGGSGGGGAAPSNEQDILTTDIALDLGALTGSASVLVQPATGASAVTLEVGGLTLTEVTLGGTAARFQVADGVASIEVPDPSEPVTVDIAYSFLAQPSTGFDGWMPDSGVTFLWTRFCGNLFPCVSNPADGAVFGLSVTGFDPSLTAVYPTTTTGQAPSYMPAVAVGEYTKKELGTTMAGTKVSAWYLPGQEADTDAGTANLTAVVDFFEQTYGPYSFGPEMGSVSANWGEGAFGGMEHHPFFHVGKDAMSDEETHAHEAAHGWFGDGVRIACWEDFVLSEGTVTYMAARGLERVGGPNLWPYYVQVLDGICSGADINTIALPDTCNEIDLITDDLWSSVPYQKGACFFEDVADFLGPDVLDERLATFYAANVGKAARMRDLIDHIEATASEAEKAQVETLVTEWLLTKACPVDYAERCGSHQP